MSVQSEFAPADAPIAKMLFVILIIGQGLLALGFICLIAMTIIMIIPSGFRTELISDLPETLETSNLAGRCIASAIVFFGWFFVLHFLRRVVRAVVHGDPFLPENVSRLRLIWIIMAVTEIFHMAAIFINGSPSAAEGINVMRLDVRIGTWFFIFIIAAISEAFRYGAALRAEQELTI